MSTPNMKLKNNQEILDRIKILSKNYLREWKPVEGDAGWAIAQSFSKMGNDLNNTLKCVPNKLFLSYLNALGFSQTPPLCATAPVSFTLIKGFKKSVLIPEKTEMLTKDKISYETNNSFTATSAKLNALLCVDSFRNTAYDFSENILKNESATLFDGAKEQQYLYFGDDSLFNIHRVDRDTNAYLEYIVPNIEHNKWEYWGKNQLDGKEGWNKFDGNSTRLNKKESFTTVKKKINGIETYWIRVVLSAPRKKQSSEYGITYRSRSGIDILYYNNQPLDPSKTIFPFGPRPQNNDIFYIASSEAFSKKGSVCGIVMQDISFQTQANGNMTMKYLSDNNHKASGSVSFEYYNGQSWKKLKIENNSNTLSDETKGINVVFNIPNDMTQTNINGDLNFWVRVKLIESKFGNYINKDNKVIENFIPPSFINLDIYVKSNIQIPQYIFRYSHESYTNLITALDNQPYSFLDEVEEHAHIIYIGFDKPFDEGLISMYFSIEKHGDIPRQAEWFIYSESNWTNLLVKDESDGFTKSGICSFVAPLNQKILNKFSKNLYWLKISFKEEVEPININGIYMNSVMVTQCKSIEKKLLGSSDGSAFQSFKLQDAPALELKLWVHEKNIPSDAIYYEDKYGEGYWVEWGKNERVYDFDEHNGEIRFGDGTNGMIPPISKNNILVSYKIGGGVAGNVDKAAINKLNSSLAYVDKITNHEAASGGADEQNIETLINSAPKRIRHRFKAVTSDDFTALAKEASSSIAKVKTISNAGFVELIIMPFSKEKKPIASNGLRKRVEEYIGSRSPATARIELRDPYYQKIDLKIIVVVNDWGLASTLKHLIVRKLDIFLHPLDGGLESKGWSFGEVPTLLDIFNLLNSLDGISYVEKVEIIMGDKLLYDLNGEKNSQIDNKVMIYSGNHTVDVVVRS